MSHYNQQPRLACIMSLARMLLLLTPLLIGACAASPNLPVRISTTEGTVVDAETKAPLAGVVVQRHLPTVYMKSNGKAETCDIPIAETVTDAQGHFVLEGKTHYCGEAENMYFTQGGSIDIYKPGYWPRSLHNRDGRIMDRIYWPGSWWSDWDGKVIEIKPMHWREWKKEDWEEKIKSEWNIDRHGRIYVYDSPMQLLPEGCDWKERPQDMVETIQYNLRKSAMFPNIYRISKGHLEDIDICPGTKDVLLKNGLSEEEWKACCEYKHRSKGNSVLIKAPGKVIKNKKTVLDRIRGGN